MNELPGGMYNTGDVGQSKGIPAWVYIAGAVAVWWLFLRKKK
jgi:hypothetical protein